MARGLVLFAHGARDAQWAAPFQAVLEKVRQASKEPVELAFLELMQPDLSSCVKNLVQGGLSEITVVPLFLGQGAHLRRDLPALIEQLGALYPQVRFHVARAAGEAQPVLEALAGYCLSEAQAK